MLQALVERDLRPDVLVGTSAGAVNAVFLGHNGFERESVERLSHLWRGLHRRDVFPVTPHRQLLAIAGVVPSLCSPKPLRRLVSNHLGDARLDAGVLPVQVIATDASSGEEVVLSDGEAVAAVMASTAIPGVLPPVQVGERELIDGGVCDNTPLSRALELGAERIVVLPAGVACALPKPPGTAVGMAIHALTILLQHRLAGDIATCGSHAELILLPPLCPVGVSPADFRHASDLIERSYRASADWLDSKAYLHEHPEQYLSIHHHRRHGSIGRSGGTTERTRSR